MFKYDFRLTSGDKNVGTVYLPKIDVINIPVIVYCHGWGGRRQLWTPTEKLCEQAMKENIAFVTFDFFGCGETGGDYSHMTFDRWKDNLAEIITWICTQPFANKDKIGCYAFSSGTTAALRLAAECSRINFVISVGTCISTHIGMVEGGPAKILSDNLEELTSDGRKVLFETDFGIDFFRDVVSNAPIHVICKIRCPILFLQGTADNPFRCADAKLAYDIMKRKRLSVTLIELAEGNHELENVADVAVNYVFSWLKSIV